MTSGSASLKRSTRLVLTDVPDSWARIVGVPACVRRSGGAIDVCRRRLGPAEADAQTRRVERTGEPARRLVPGGLLRRQRTGRGGLFSRPHARLVAASV